MFNWHLQQYLNNIHDHWHYDQTQLTQAQLNNPQHFVDHSCHHCYPSQNIPNRRYFAFWNWYIANTSAYQNTQKTSESFYRFLNFTTDADRIRELHNLLFTTRFREEEDPNTLIPLILNCSEYTQRFTQNLDRLNNIQNIADNDFDTTDDEDNNNNIINGLLDDMNNNANAQQLINLIQTIADRQLVQNITTLPTYGGGDQDPVEWIEEFERCGGINGYTWGDLLASVSGYLLNEARSWYAQIDGDPTTRFQSWQTPTNRNFKQSFLTRFRNPGKLLQWRMELNSRVQQPQETVQLYAQTIRKLIKRVETDVAMPESEKIFNFTKGLRREIAAHVSTQLSFQPNPTLEQVIEAASRMEKHGQMYPETLIGFYGQTSNSNQIMPPVQYQQPMNNYVQPQIQAAPITNANETLNVLLQALGNLNLNQTPVQNNPNNNYNMRRNNQGNRPPRNPGLCYRCQQPGHISRNCPNQQQPVNNVVNPTPQPTMQNFAQQVPIQPAVNQPQVQQQYPVMQMQPQQPQPQVVPQPIHPVQMNNLPPQPNNVQRPPGNNVFVATGQQQMQQPQMQTYDQSLNWNTHL